MLLSRSIILALAVASAAPISVAAAQAASSNPTAALLADLIRVNTSNPPGNTRGIDEWVDVPRAVIVSGIVSLSAVEMLT